MSNANSKGKGRAQPDEDDTTAQANNTTQSPSLLSRVTASATGLTRNALGTPSSNEVNDYATTALTNSGKGSRAFPGNSNSAWAESSTTAPLANSQASGLQGFRQPQSEEHAQQAEAEFSAFLDGTDLFTPSASAIPGLNATPSRDDEAPLDEAWRRAQSSSTFTSSGPAPITVSEQESRDGDAVLALLSDPSTTHDPFEAPGSEEENYDWGLSVEQILQLRAMTKDLLPPPEPHGHISPDHPLNLNPRANRDQLQNDTAEESWREQWEGVLTRYADEVWGGLLPLVREARREIEQMGNQPESTEPPKALRRLGAILNHLRQP